MKSYELVKLKMLELGINRNKFATQVLGYKNINKGLRKVDGILEGGDILSEDVPKIAKGLSISEEELLNAMIETEQEIQMEQEKLLKEKRDKERADFVPYFYTINERSVPQPIFMGNMTHNMRFVYYTKEFLDYTLDEQLNQIRFDIVEHFYKNEGQIPAFGQIQYYVYRYDYDLSSSELIVLDTSGEVKKNTVGLRVNEGSPGGITLRNSKTHIEQLFEAKKNIIDRRN